MRNYYLENILAKRRTGKSARQLLRQAVLMRPLRRRKPAPHFRAALRQRQAKARDYYSDTGRRPPWEARES